MRNVAVRALALPARPLLAATYHVEPHARDAADANPGTQAWPFKTIAAGTAVLKAGDTLRIGTGVYREAATLTASGTKERPIGVEAAPGAHVVVTGADLLSDWQRENASEGERVYATAWPHRFVTWSKTGTHPADDYHRLIGRAEQGFINHYPLRQVLSRDQLTRGTFFADLERRRLYVQAAHNAPLDQGKDLVEASTRATLWNVQGDYTITGGLTVRYGAIPAQQGLAGAVPNAVQAALGETRTC